MKVSKEQNTQNRNALIDAASKLFQAQGFAATGVAQISEEAGLTQGAFYAHFKSKTLLIQAACQKAFSTCHGAWTAMKGTQANDLQTIIDSYVTPVHVDDPAEGCPMAAYASEIKSQDEPVKDTFTEGLQNMVGILNELLAKDFSDEAARRNALFFMSSMVGSVALARATKSTDPALAAEIITATRESLLAVANAGAS
ncbi:TetR/AcrR family transcriptional regulator [Pseudomonas sp. NPDC090203]|uniref:TetR/AcrR family transcriptional regulator n=1 Tax=Pseudomonas sp. NPDC090203 TaxID=3364477 RepID=UPI0037F5DFD7